MLRRAARVAVALGIASSVWLGTAAPASAATEICVDIYVRVNGFEQRYATCETIPVWNQSECEFLLVDRDPVLYSDISYCLPI